MSQVSLDALEAAGTWQRQGSPIKPHSASPRAPSPAMKRHTLPTASQASPTLASAGSMEMGAKRCTCEELLGPSWVSLKYVPKALVLNTMTTPAGGGRRWAGEWLQPEHSAVGAGVPGWHGCGTVAWASLRGAVGRS